jgi:NAD(P)-dependent dehydrogenase (short-subunit alcohol dehydrogenase family)/acyl carrier protein
MENQGAKVLVLRADVADADQMKAALAQACDQFGQIQGVIHAAGIAGDRMTMLLKKPDVAASVMAPKVNGTLVLGQLLHEIKLDFLVLCSSLSAQLGGIGHVDYCAANAFLDAYAQKYHSEKNLISVDWGTWQEVGMAVNTPLPFYLNKEQRERSLRLGISPEEGKEAISRILGRSHPQVIVSPEDLTAVMQTTDKSGESLAVKQVTESFLDEPTHPRPDLSSDYIAPGNSTERTIAGIWQELLGLEKVGIHDNFFELGGHSLLATSLVARMKSLFPVELPVASLFENPTVHSLSEVVRQGGRDGRSLDESRSRGQKRKERIRG